MENGADQSVSLLFNSFRFGKGTLRNRIAMAPMTRNHSPNGIPGEDVVEYYRRRAAGGAGLIITEGTYIDHPAANGYRHVPAFHGAALDGWRRVADAVHDEGALIIPQLWHVGSVRRAGMEPHPDIPGIGPVEIAENGKAVVTAMTVEDIQAVVQSYARAACDAEQAGFDGVEVHAAHGYLIDQFLWQESNRRTDEYGGPIAARGRFATEIVAAIRRSVSADFPVVFRFSQWKMSDYSARIATSAEELSEILQPLSDAGVDIFHASTRRFWEPAFEGSAESLAACTRRVTGKPVIAVGSVGLEQPHQTRRFRTAGNISSDVADLGGLIDCMKANAFDLVAVGRGMLADAQWANKVRRGEMNTLNPLEEEVMQKLI
jgi:2,4-dienoyl-CoA reductase-like NADH-dependent reductase (Old Yellow Enzyme family)